MLLRFRSFAFSWAIVKSGNMMADADGVGVVLVGFVGCFDRYLGFCVSDDLYMLLFFSFLLCPYFERLLLHVYKGIVWLAGEQWESFGRSSVKDHKLNFGFVGSCYGTYSLICRFDLL